MNIFYLDDDPTLAAIMLCDKHVVKMLLETTQLLCTAHSVLDGEAAPKEFYKATHKNHPCAKWTRSNVNNYYWLYDYYLSLCEEYTRRYYKTHACEKFSDALSFPPINIEEYKSFYSPPQCMPDKYKCEDTVDAYRDYYNGEKLKFAKWTNRDIPWWVLSRNIGEKL